MIRLTIIHLGFLVLLGLTMFAASAPPSELVIDFEQAETGTWIKSWEEQGAVCHLAWQPTRTKAPGRVTVFPHLATGRKGLVCAMADEPIPVQVDFPQAASSVTGVFWASTGCAAVLEAIDLAGNVIATARLSVAPARAAPGDPVPFFELTVSGTAIAGIRFSGPRPGEFLAADELHVTTEGERAN